MSVPALVPSRTPRTARPAVAALATLRRIPLGPLLAWAVLVLLAVAALTPGLLAPQPPNAVDPVNALAPPGSEHLLGTDQLGRDVYSRLVHGTRDSLVVGLGATGLALGAGALLGVLAATARAVVDEVLMRLTDILLAFPGLLLALLVIALLGPGTGHATLAIGLSMLPGFVRLARAQALLVGRADYVHHAVGFGQPRWTARLRHVVPNALPPLVVFATLSIAGAVIAGASLSFLGLGPQPPDPEWGAMLAEGRGQFEDAWALALGPGVAVLLTAAALTVVGRDLQRRLEGRHGHGRR
ncbi:ABC transporter permease [Kitasatospora sp. NPDC004745]|uniref:ABC transporter permease n=1 Tax=unclassified Kitasatospora TaxID=2633591 RepID=UPI0033E525F6